MLECASVALLLPCRHTNMSHFSEDDSQTNPDKIEEGTSPRKRSKVDNGTNEGDHTKISEPLGQTPQEWQHKGFTVMSMMCY